MSTASGEGCGSNTRVQDSAVPTRLCVWVLYIDMGMPDTKRGRERKGRTKRQQRREHEIERALAARDRSRDFEELYEDEEIDLDI